MTKSDCISLHVVILKELVATSGNSLSVLIQIKSFKT
jgi:hypothetical protein